jgi:predicted RNA-binding Zn-ribbon protein involved in translation (DUF1610 family)
MGLLHGYRCPECGSDDLLDNSDYSSAATKALCKDCGYSGVVNKERRAPPR